MGWPELNTVSKLNSDRRILNNVKKNTIWFELKSPSRLIKALMKYDNFPLISSVFYEQVTKNPQFWHTTNKRWWREWRGVKRSDGNKWATIDGRVTRAVNGVMGGDDRSCVLRWDWMRKMWWILMKVIDDYEWTINSIFTVKRLETITHTHTHTHTHTLVTNSRTLKST